MITVVVTDCKYRSSIAAVRSLGRAGYNVVCVATCNDTKENPPAFFSKYAGKCVTLDCSSEDEIYKDKLIEQLKEFENPVLFPIGANTFESIAKNIGEYSSVCRFNVSPCDILDKANDKVYVTRLAKSIGIPTPEEYDVSIGEAPDFPCIIKPRCGEKAGLKAAQRYVKCYNKDQFDAAYKKISAYDPSPIVEALISGEGVGVSVVTDKRGECASVICHRRVREYPIGGGPSTCLESIYDEELVNHAVRLLRSLDFRGIAMVEFKGGRLLEINPRIWGSFPMTEYAGSSFAQCYVRSALGEKFDLPDISYRRGAKMHFIVNDAVCILSLFAHGEIGKALSGVVDFLRPGVRDAIRDKEDKKPFRVYIKRVLK